MDRRRVDRRPVDARPGYRSQRRRHATTAAPACVLAAVLAGSLGACSTASGTAPPGRAAITVVAAENVWGSIARQLGGDKVSVTSIIASPGIDPHDYEPRAQDARAVASADYVIVNGVGYDQWASKLAAAGGRDQLTLDVGDLVGVKAGGNPHRWYSPPDVQRVVDRISADYQRLDPADAAYFADQKAAFESTGLARYHGLIADIRRRYLGTPVGASESVFAPMAGALGLRLVTPEAFLDAISEGTEPTARDKATVDAQLKAGQVKVYVYNSQNSTPDVKAQVGLATAAGIPVTSVTETLAPATATFQDWQAGQLERLSVALATMKAA